MRKREMINYVNGEKIMADLFGHSKDLITLSPLVLQSETKSTRTLNIS